LGREIADGFLLSVFARYTPCILVRTSIGGMGFLARK